MLFIIAGAVLSIVAIVLLVIAISSNGDETTTTTTTTTAATTTTTEPTFTVVTPSLPPTIELPPPVTTSIPQPQDLPGFPSQEQWVAFRECQTGSDYTAVSPSSTNFGAYQFRVATWDELAARRYPELVGINPAEATPADQDRMGYALWEEHGISRWPACGETLSTSATATTTTTEPTTTATTTTTTTPATATTAPATTTGYDPDALGPAAIPDVPGFPSQQQWAAFRECQTDGDYTTVSPGGTNYGAYQFRIPTWDELAGRKFPSLVGIRPSDASPADQDRMGYALWEERGTAPWPECGPQLTAEFSTTVPPPPPLPTDNPATTTTTTTVPTTTTTIAPIRGQPTAQQWENLRQCESYGDYTIVSSDGLHYGAYQFTVQTWDDVASRHATNLVGTLPSAASVAQQDFMAQRLYQERGWQPWPVCGARHLQ